MALLVVDVQRKFILERDDWPEVSGSAVRRINLLADMFRKRGRPVLFIATDGYGHGTYDGDDADEWLEGVECLPCDTVVHKNGMSGFKGTGLHDILKGMGVDCVLITGMYTEFCVAGTYYSASERSLAPCIADGAVIGYYEGINDAARMMMGTVDLETLERFLDGRQAVYEPIAH